MKNKLIFLLGMTLFISSSVIAQVGIGTTDPKGALDITSTTNGILVPRMSTVDRNNITTPENALLIFNTSNNTFEVYKFTCSCWVTITDEGNTPAQNLVNTAPTANSLNYTGSSIVGKTITFNYTYNDAQADIQTNSIIQWQVASTNSGTGATSISGATTTSYIPVAGNAGMWIRATLKPRAATGVMNGITYYGSWLQVEASTIPTANNLSVTGTPSQGSTLNASYTFAGGSETENVTLTGTTYNWQTATTNIGAGITAAPLYSNSSYGVTYIPQADLLGRFIRVGVLAKDSNNLSATNIVYSSWIGPITEAGASAPVASAISYSPAPAEGVSLIATYVYFDANDDPEDISTFQWYRANDASGGGQVTIAGATNSSYTPTALDGNKFVGVGVTPIAQSGGFTTGTEVIYYNANATVPKAVFTFTANPIKQLPFFVVNRAMNAQNAIQVEIDVATFGGGIAFASTTVNGYSFSANYVTTTTGTQWVTLQATGTQTAYNSSGDNFTITGTGATNQTKAITINHEVIGSSLTTFSNGGALNENFSTNSLCQNSILSTGYTAGSCTGSVTVGSNSYPVVLINGQCWMVTNINEASTAPCGNAINSGCNTWTTASVSDMGYWGYYNTTSTTGTAGWATNVPAAGEGLLYQWSAAMNGTTHERAQGVCPTGWHIPSDCEWMYLEHGQGMALASQTTTIGWRNTTGESNKLRTTNTSGFTVLLTGQRLNTTGVFSSRTTDGYFWTSSATNLYSAYARRFISSQAGIRKDNQSKSLSFPVRCLRD